MTIIHVVEAFAGGIVVFVKSLVENMPEDTHIIIHGERSSVIKAAEIKKQFPPKKVRFFRWKSAQRSLYPHKDVMASIELYRVLRRLKKNNLADAVHLHSSKSGFIGRLICNMLNITNVVYTPNGAPFLVGNNVLTNYLYKKLEQLGSLFGGKVVCCSPSELLAYQQAGIPAININNGISLPKSGNTIVSRSQKPGSTFTIVTSGRILHQKNPELFNSIATYFQDLPWFKFIWIGEGTDAPKLTSSNISITGWLPNTEVKHIIINSNMYISTARFEGLPYAVLESLTLKKPVLLTNCVGNQDLVKTGLNGDLYNNKDEAIVKILQYFNNRDMLNIMGEYSVTHCDHSFNVQKTYTDYRKLYIGDT